MAKCYSFVPRRRTVKRSLKQLERTANLSSRCHGASTLRRILPVRCWRCIFSENRRFVMVLRRIKHFHVAFKILPLSPVELSGYYYTMIGYEPDEDDNDEKMGSVDLGSGF